MMRHRRGHMGVSKEWKHFEVYRGKWDGREWRKRKWAETDGPLVYSYMN